MMSRMAARATLLGWSRHMRCSTRAAVMTGGVEAIMAERRHDLDLIDRHGAEGIIRMIGATRRLFGIAIAAQIGGDNGELLGEARREFVPGQMTERIAVHEQKRRPLAGMHGDDARTAGLDLGVGEIFEHCACDHLRRGLSSPSSPQRALTAAMSSAAGQTSGGKRAPSNSGSGS